MVQNLFRTTQTFLETKAVLEATYSSDAEPALNELVEMYRPIVEERSEDIAKYVKELQLVAAAQKAEAAALTDAAKQNAARAERIMKDLEHTMMQMGLKEVKAGPYQFKFKKGSTVTIVDESRLPDQYWKEVPATKQPLSKPELKKLMDAGTMIEGVQIVKNPDTLTLK